jgi:hypothetical protein
MSTPSACTNHAHELRPAVSEARCTCGGRGICTTCILGTLAAEAAQLTAPERHEREHADEADCERLGDSSSIGILSSGRRRVPASRETLRMRGLPQSVLRGSCKESE